MVAGAVFLDLTRVQLGKCGDRSMIQLLTLEEWAAEKYRSAPPDVSTLRRYVNHNLFSPAAVKHGRLWRVREDAEIVGELTKPEISKTDSAKLLRILVDGSSTT